MVRCFRGVGERMRYFKKTDNDNLTELKVTEFEYSGAEEIERAEHDGLVLGIRVFLSGEDETDVKNDLNKDGYYDE